MFTLNINSEYLVTGTNGGTAFCLSSDAKPTGGSLKNGYVCIEMDTGKVYFYSEGDENWYEFGAQGGEQIV